MTLRLYCDLFVDDGRHVEKRHCIRFEDRVTEWALNTLGYIPKAYAVSGRIQIWFRSLDDHVLYLMFVGQKDYIDVYCTGL